MRDINILRKQFSDVPKFQEYQLNKENIFKFKIFNDFQEGFITFSSYKTDDLNKAIKQVKKVYKNHSICDHYIIEVYALNPKPKELIIRGTTIKGYNTGEITGKHYFYDWDKIKDLDIYLPRKRGN
jgi:hypothetical protein|tara:strand:- start:1155 stop:1532 length:378 start_codon:yes stop_codon:yes gene_type:complete